jgi:Galactose oxidase, central domain
MNKPSLWVCSLFSVALFINSGNAPQIADTTRPSGRAGHCLVYDEQLQMVLLLNGFQPPYQPEQSEIWGWNGARWSLLVKNGPAARSLSGAAYDGRHKRVVEFGGVGNDGYSELKSDTWEWDGRAWHLMADTSVGTRDHHAMVYDEARGVTVMYGGQNSARQFDTNTWEWNGTAWKKIAASGPGNRVHHAMAYDAKRKRVVLFGGFGGGDNLGDTWEWDGKAWQQVATSGPPPRARHRMAFDAKLGKVILFGGTGVKTTPGPGFNFLGDTWLWDGRAWSEAKVSGPPARCLHAMAYDAHRQKVVLFGGGNGGNDRINDTWEWDGKVWQKVQ